MSSATLLRTEPSTADRPQAETVEWHIGVYCCNEEDRIAGCIAAIDEAVQFAGRRALVSVLVNGSTDRSLRRATVAARAAKCQMRVHELASADKSSAINSFYEGRAPGAQLYFGIDGYVHVARESLLLLEQALEKAPEALAASGGAANGRSLQAFTQAANASGGQICGGLHALRPAFLEKMTSAGIRLPAGLYRGDGLLGFLARTDFNPAGGELRSRVVGVQQAHFALKTSSARNPKDLARQLRRKLNQMRGKVENAAIKHIALHHPDGFKALPGCAYDMMRAHLKAHGAPPVGLLDRPWMALALRQIRHGRTQATASPNP